MQHNKQKPLLSLSYLLKTNHQTKDRFLTWQTWKQEIKQSKWRGFTLSCWNSSFYLHSFKQSNESSIPVTLCEAHTYIYTHTGGKEAKCTKYHSSSSFYVSTHASVHSLIHQTKYQLNHPLTVFSFNHQSITYPFNHPFIHSFINPNMYPSNLSFVHAFSQPSTNLIRIHSFIHMTIHLSTIYSSIINPRSATQLFIHPSIHLGILPTTHNSILPSILLSIKSFIHPTFQGNSDVVLLRITISSSSSGIDPQMFRS